MAPEDANRPEVTSEESVWCRGRCHDVICDAAAAWAAAAAAAALGSVREGSIVEEGLETEEDRRFAGVQFDDLTEIVLLFIVFDSV